MIHTADEIIPIRMSYRSTVCFIKKRRLPYSANPIYRVYLKRIIMKHYLFKSLRHCTSIIFRVGMRAFPGTGQTKKCDGTLSKILGILTSAEIYFLNTTMTCRHTKSPSGGPCKSQGSFFSFTKIPHTKIENNI